MLGARRALGLLKALPTRLWPVGLPVVAYLLAIAPVLLAGRPTFSGYGVLPDSALHMIGADYLIRHGQDYANLDLRNSYGQYIHSYFATSYPSGSHTLFGGSAEAPRPAADLGAPVLLRLHPRDRHGAGVAARPARRPATAVGRRWRR